MAWIAIAPSIFLGYFAYYVTYFAYDDKRASALKIVLPYLFFLLTLATLVISTLYDLSFAQGFTWSVLFLFLTIISLGTLDSITESGKNSLFKP